MKVYIAGPLFNEGERSYLEKIDKLCKSLKIDTYLPQRDAAVWDGEGDTFWIYKRDRDAVVECDFMIAVLNGQAIDPGTAWEIGYAIAKGKKVIGLLEDVRFRPVDINLMITNSVQMVQSIELLRKELEKIK